LNRGSGVGAAAVDVFAAPSPDDESPEEFATTTNTIATTRATTNAATPIASIRRRL
jgi:hypothetical protein